MAFKSIYSLLHEGRNGDTLVAWCGDSRVSWREFRARVERLRHRRQDGCRRVLLTDSDPVDFLAHLLAVLADGDVPVIPPNFQDETLASLAQLEAPEASVPPVVEIYTSGSTGEPKCIRKRVADLEVECRVLEACWGGLAGNATFAATTPHHHIYGLLFRLLWPLCAGRPFDGATLADPAAMVERLEFLLHSVLVSSPAQLSRIPSLIDLERIKRKPLLLFSSGGPLSLDIALRYQASWGVPPVEVFGSTESGGVAWRRQTDDSRWTPLPGVTIRTDEDSALLVDSPFLPPGESLRMEDAIDLDTDGRFVLRGRLDRIVKIEEKRLSLPEMEAWLAQHEAVARCAIVSLPIGARAAVGAVVVQRPGGTGDGNRRELIGRLNEHLQRRFDRVLLPRRWRFVDQLPYDGRGKLPADALISLLRAPI